MTARYVTTNHLERLEQHLSDRDRAIVDTLDRLRVATTSQLRKLHFDDLTTATAARQAPRTLRRLARERVLTELPRRVGGVRAGSQAAVWALDAAGQRLASACGPAGGTRSRRPWVPGLAFLAHRLAVSELYVGLRTADRTGELALLDFDAEPHCWRRFAAAHGGWSQLKPDAFVRLRIGDYERGAFIEIDRATESAPTLSRKCRVYRQYWETGREQQRRGYFPRVIWSVPTDARREVAVDVCARQPEETWPLYRVVEHERLLSTLIEPEAV